MEIMNQTPKVEGRRAFTVIELLIVILIIGVLIGFAFPVFQGVLDRAKKVQAKNDVTQIVTAVNAFYTEYGRYPTTATTDATATYGPGHLSSKAVFDELRAKSIALNTRQIIFISPPEDTSQTSPKGKIGSDGQ
jgi:prepilin-type N-terminal cleavage/methylation domain-containing protein